MSPFCAQHKHLAEDNRLLRAWKRICWQNLHWYDPQINHVKLCLEHGLVTPTEDLYREAPLRKYRTNVPTYFFNLLAPHTPDLQRSWFTRGDEELWSYTLHILWTWSVAMGPILIDWASIRHMICLVKDPLAFYSGCALRWVHQNEEYNASKWYEFFDDCFQQSPEWAYAFLAIPWDEHKAAIEEKNFPLQTLKFFHRAYMPTIVVQQNPAVAALRSLWLDTSQWKECLVTVLASMKTYKKASMNCVKEELMASTWHPLRFQRWCLDEDDKAELREMWPQVDPNARTPTE